VKRIKKFFRLLATTFRFPDEKIVASLSQQLSWSHFRELLPLERPLQCEFYAEMSRVEGWSVKGGVKVDHCGGVKGSHS
jgi:hypothetical protein